MRLKSFALLWYLNNEEGELTVLILRRIELMMLNWTALGKNLCRKKVKKSDSVLPN